MKLKILPPTLRIDNHYLTLDIKSEVEIDKNDLISAIWYGCIRLFGELETSSFNLWLMKFYEIRNSNGFLDINIIDRNDNKLIIDENNNEYKIKNLNNHKNNNDLNYYSYKAILQCQRGFEDKVRGSLASLSNYNNKKIAITTIGISGTISSSMEKFIN